MPTRWLAVLPPWLAGLVVSAIMAAIMSTASGFLLSVASSVTQDVYHPLVRPVATERELVLVSRLVTLALGVGALILALGTDPLDPRSTVYKLVLYGWGGLAGCFSAPVTLVDNAYEVIPAMLLSALSILVVSRLTRAAVTKGLVTS